MTTNHHRRSIRLRGYDYSKAGAYFITVCTQKRACLFGDIIDGEMVLNDAGEMIKRWWLELNKKYPSIETDEFVTMPNHFHGIVIITGAVGVGADLCVRPDRIRPGRIRPESNQPVVTNPPGRTDTGGTDMGTTDTDLGATDRGAGGQGAHAGGTTTDMGAHAGAPLRSVVQWFKTMSTNEYIRGVKKRGWAPFPGKLWQRNYYEHIVRNEPELNRVRQYIVDNPAKWATDRDHPDAWADARDVREPPLPFREEG